MPTLPVWRKLTCLQSISEHPRRWKISVHSIYLSGKQQTWAHWMIQTSAHQQTLSQQPNSFSQHRASNFWRIWNYAIMLLLFSLRWEKRPGDMSILNLLIAEEIVLSMLTVLKRSSSLAVWRHEYTESRLCIRANSILQRPSWRFFLAARSLNYDCRPKGRTGYQLKIGWHWLRQYLARGTTICAVAGQ